MIVAIPYKRDKLNGTELKYAIRSIAQHFRWGHTFTLITDKPPTWYKGAVIPCRDRPGRKEYNLYRKLMTVKPEIVLYTNDDFFALEDFDRNLPYYSSKTCGTYRPKDPAYRKLYNNCPAEWINFDIHTPMIINAAVYPEWTIDRPIKTTYANMLKLPATEIVDCKFSKPRSKEEILEIIADRPFFSTDQRAVNKAMIEVFEQLYPKPSCCE